MHSSKTSWQIFNPGVKDKGIFDKFAISRIRTIMPIDTVSEVWDLEVASSHHVFATESGLAHNCDYCRYKHECWGVR